MSFRRRALFLAGLFVAVSCSDAGNPLDPNGPEVPEPGSEEMALQALSCEVDADAGTLDCQPLEPGAGDALGAINIGGGSSSANGTYVRLTKITATDVRTPTSHTFDVTIKNNMVGQIIGTTDGTTAHPYGMKVFFYNPANAAATQPVVTEKTNSALPASVTVNGDGSQKFAGAGTQVRPFFQYPAQILLPGQTSTAKQWSFTLDNVSKYSFVVYVSTEVRYPKGWLNIIPDSPVVQVDSSRTLTAQVRNAFGVRISEALTWSSSNPAVVTITSSADSTAVITGVGEGGAYVKAVTNHPNAADKAARRDSVWVTVDNAPAVQPDSIDVPARAMIRLSSQRLRQGLAVGDSVVPSQQQTTAKGVATVDAQRGFTYVSKGKFTGTDTVTINVTDGRWTVARRLLVKVAPTNYWFVQPGASGNGSNASPLGSISAAVDSADMGDTIFVLRNGSTDLVGAATLEADQTLMGHGVPNSTLVQRTGLNEPGRVDTIFQGQGLGTPLANTSAPVLTLSGNNTVLGVNITATDAAGIHGVGFGTLTVGQVGVTASGPSLSLSNGTLAGTFMSLHSANSDSSGLTLNLVNGTLAPTGATIAGAATTAISVSGGAVNVSMPGGVTHGGSGRLLDVASHTGSITFEGAVQATSGTGLLFNDADGSYTFNGAVTLNGGDAGLDVVGSDGVITFADASITSPSGGPAVTVQGGTPALVYRGAITHNTGRAVLVDGITADSVVLRAALNSGTADAPTGQGILVQNVSGGRVVLDSIKSLFTGTNPAVTLTGNTGGLVRFGGSLAITTTTGAGFTASGSDTVTVTGVNSVTTTTGVPVSLASVHTGTGGISFSTVSTSAGAPNGIVLSSLAGGAGFQATGGTISGTSGAAVQLTSMGGVDSTSIRGMTLSRSGGAGAVVSGTNFGKLHVLNTSVTAAAGPSALALNTGTLSGTFSTLSSNSSTSNGVSLTSVAGSLNASAGSINTAGAAAFLLSGGTVAGTVSATVAQATAAQPLLTVTNGHNGAITFAGNLTATNGTGLQFTDADGTYTLTGSLSLAGGDAGIDVASGSTGTIDVNPAGGNTAAITSPSGVAISVVGGSADLTFRGNVTQANNVSLLSVTSGHSGDLSFPSGTVSATNGNGLQLDNADGTYVFGGTVTLNGGDAGIDITNGSGGTFTFPATSNITSPSTGNLVSILNSAPTFTYSGAFTKSNNNVTGILVSGNTGGSITFNGTGTKSISSGSAAAVNLASNTGASILFSGGGLNITSGTGNGLTATGGGTLQVTGATNVISSSGGIALNVVNTTIGASGLSFQSISASGGSNGIVLNNTGSTNGLQVTGTGTHASGGTIVNTTGANSAVAGNGVYLEDATNVNLNWINLSGHANHAIRGVDVSNVTLNRLRITGTNGDDVNVDEGSVSFSNLTGTASITSSFIEGGVEDNVRVVNTSGVLNRLVMTSDTIGHNGTNGNSGVLVTGLQSAVVNATVQNSRFTGARSNVVSYVINESASGDVVISGNVITNNHPNKVGSEFGINIGHASNGAVTYAVGSNSVNGSGGSGIEVGRLAGGTGSMTGSITGNNVGTTGVANSGSNASSAIVVGIVGTGSTATHTTTVSGNTLRQYANYGIRVINRGTGAGYLNATVQNNNISEPSPNAASFGAYSALRAELGAASADDGKTCLNITGNTMHQDAGSTQATLRIFARFLTKTALPGLTAAGANSFLAGQNTITGTATAVNATSTNAFQSTCPPA